jgi:hypothetical protein
MLREAFGEYSLNQAAVFEWHSRFQADRVAVETHQCKQLGNMIHLLKV